MKILWGLKISHLLTIFTTRQWYVTFNQNPEVFIFFALVVGAKQRI